MSLEPNQHFEISYAFVDYSMLFSNISCIFSESYGNLVDRQHIHAQDRT
jgi:hypothetical protein